jgi:hypothetical protein
LIDDRDFVSSLYFAFTLNLNELYKNMLPDDIIVSYKGAPSQSLLDSLLSIADEKLTAIEPQSNLKKKVYHILIEALQNLYHHLDTKALAPDKEADTILFILARQEGGGYIIITGNYLPTAEVSKLRSHIDKINSASKEEIKQLYRAQLHAGEVSEKGGAGLGIIDIARRSGQKLDYSFEEGLCGNSFFSLKIKISA